MHSSEIVCYLKNHHYLELQHKTQGELNVLGKNGLHIRIQQETIYRNDELFFLGIEKKKSFKTVGQRNIS